MAKDRMIRAKMRENDEVNQWPYALRYFWTQLWGYCDDFGRGRRDPRLVKAGVMPIDDEATVEVVDRWMIGLESAGVIRGYLVGSKRFFEVVNWDDNQEIKYRTKTDIPGPDGVIPKPGKSSEILQKDSPEGEVEGEVEREGEAIPESPPSPFCKKHPGGTDDPCRACGNARRRRDAWDLAQRTKPTPVPRAARADDGHLHSWDTYGNCTLCEARLAVAS